MIEFYHQKEHTKTKIDAYDTASELYNDLLKIYFDEYYNFSGAERKMMDPHMKLFNTDTYDYTESIKKIKN